MQGFAFIVFVCHNDCHKLEYTIIIIIVYSCALLHRGILVEEEIIKEKEILIFSESKILFFFFFFTDTLVSLIIRYRETFTFFRDVFLMQYIKI